MNFLRKLALASILMLIPAQSFCAGDKPLNFRSRATESAMKIPQEPIRIV